MNTTTQPLFLYLIIISLLPACTNPTGNSTHTAMEFKNIPVTYPFARKDTTVKDTYFGNTINDPYRWLEDDNSAETKEWVTKQNLVTFGYLEQFSYRGKIKSRLEQIWNFEKFGTPFKKAGKYYFFKNDGLQNQSVLYGQDNLDAKPYVVLDPNSFSTDGTSSLQEMGLSKNGQYLAYAVSKGGSDWRTIRVKNLQSGAMLTDSIEWAKFTGIAWASEGFYYSRYPEPKASEKLTGSNQNSSIYYHAIGTSQDKDRLIFEDPAHPNHYFGADVTEDERFLLLTSSESTSGNTLAFKDLSEKASEFTHVAKGFDHDFNVIENFADQLLVLTNNSAPNKRLILIDSKKPQENHWKTLIPEDAKDVLENATVCGDKIICTYLHDASSLLKVFDQKGNLVKTLELPEIGTVGGVSGDKGDPTAFFSFTSFLRPTTIFRLDTDKLEPEVFKAPKLDFDASAYTTEQVWYKSKDGTSVPMFITRKKNIAKNGQNPTMLYGYGGFNISVTPGFSASRAALLENNGIYVVANIRGGGEFGEAWHKAGVKCKKQNVFDDFIGAAEYLVAEQYTNPKRLAIEGGSNGGLLVGACMTQRPELFGVCFPRVGVLDMLRYHQFTIGYAWAVDYGRSDDKNEFPCLMAYSPLHNVKKVAYPATMITTADHDDRVVPAHSFKFAATLQEHQQGDQPVLIRIETSAGHGAGKPTSKLLEEASDMLAFMLYVMKVPLVY